MTVGHDDLSTADGLSIVRDGRVLRVRLTRPEVRNAQTPAMWRAMARIPEYLDDSIRVVVIAGAGASFSAGLDRRMLTPEGVEPGTSLLHLAQQSDADIDAFIVMAQGGFTWTRLCPVPVVAYVQGHAVGAGFQLALAADMVVVSPDATFAMRETSLGLVPDLAGTAPLVAAVGYQRAFEICVTGRWVEASEAVRLGIATACVEQDRWSMHETALLDGLQQLRPGAVTDLKRLLRGLVDSDEQLTRERALQIGRLRDVAGGASA